ncbi:MAG: SBBP repeat-containing protein [Bryobacteraceae bacterium]
MRLLHFLLLASSLAVANPVTPARYGRTPVRFEPNAGQADSRVLFLSRDNGFQVYLTRNEAVFALEAADRTEFLRMRVEGASPGVRVQGEEALAGRSNYLIGNDPANWHKDVPHFGRVRYQGIYPGIDLVYYSKESRLEYDFVLAPGADPGAIRLAYQGAEPPHVDANGDLRLRLPGGSVYQRQPVAYQVIDGRRHPVTARYVVANRQVRLRLGEYDPAKELIVDPVISFSTFLGGNAGERGTGIAVDAQGNAYITGATASANFPAVGAYQNTLKGTRDVFVTKINAAGTAILYSTFIGGTQTTSGFGQEQGMDVFVDSQGSAIVAGTTNSSNFPIIGAAYQATFGGGFGDAFVLKLNTAGNQLVFSTYLGGNNTDEIYGMAVDPQGNISVVGATASPNFPIQLPYQGNFKGEQDAFVAKLNSTGSALVYSTYLGGGKQERAYDVAVDAVGNAYVTGETESTDFPVLNAYQATKSSSYDVFLTKFFTGGTVAYSTFLGGTGRDQGFGVAVDLTGNVYVAGETASANFPVLAAYQATFGGFSDAFVTKFAAAGGSLIYSTFLGGSLSDGAFALAVDGQGQPHITGRTWSSNFPKVDAFQTTYAGAFSDGFVAKFGSAGGSLIYSSYIGGANEDNSDNNAGFLGVGGVAIDSSGNAYYTGRTDSENFKTTAGVLQPAFGGRSFAVGDDNAGDAFVMKIGGSGISIGGSGLRFQPVAPCRIVDTRNPAGTFGGPVMAGGSVRSFPIPQSVCGIPATAASYSLNVTVVPRGPLSYLTIWPTGQAQPLVSTLNSFGGTIVANAAIVPAGIGGAISVFVTDTTDVILDINGYFDTPSPYNYSFFAANPCRVADTRLAPGAFGGPSMAASQTRSFTVPASPCGIPGTSRAYSMNVTVVPAGPLAYLTTWPAGQIQPLVSTLNSFQGKIVANAALVPSGTNGAINAFVTNPTEVILDINGYFAPPSAGGLSFYAATPCRVVDTRLANGPFGGPILEGGTSRSFLISQSACGIPATAEAFSLNVTVVPTGGLSYLTAWPSGFAQPLVSTLNSFDGSIVANAAIVPAGAFGGVNVFVTDRTHVILDINGYFAP